jgi:hypothetical protein
MLGGNDVSLIILILLLLKCSSCSFVKPSKILDPSVQDLSLLSSSEIYSNNGKRLKKYLGMNARYNDSSQIDFSFFKGVNISLISLELNWMILCDKSNSIRFGQFLNKELGSMTKLKFSYSKLYTLNHLRNYTKCLTRLKNINLLGISLRIIPNNIFSKLPSLKSLTMSKMSSQLIKIHPNAFNSSSLTILTFSRADGFRFTQGMAQKGLFEPSSIWCNFLDDLTYITWNKKISTLSDCVIHLCRNRV